MPYPNIEDIHAFREPEYFVKTEIASFMTFGSVVAHLGRPRRRSQPRRSDTVTHSNTYRPLHIKENPLGAIGSWALHFKEEISIPISPDRPLEEQPIGIRPSLVIMDTSLPEETFLEDCLPRPEINLHIVDGGSELKYAYPEGVLKGNLQPYLVEQARYVLWLMLAQQEVFTNPQFAR